MNVFLLYCSPFICCSPFHYLLIQTLCLLPHSALSVFSQVQLHTGLCLSLCLALACSLHPFHLLSWASSLQSFAVPVTIFTASIVLPASSTFHCLSICLIFFACFALGFIIFLFGVFVNLGVVLIFNCLIVFCSSSHPPNLCLFIFCAALSVFQFPFPLSTDYQFCTPVYSLPPFAILHNPKACYWGPVSLLFDVCEQRRNLGSYTGESPELGFRSCPFRLLCFNSFSRAFCAFLSIVVICHMATQVNYSCVATWMCKEKKNP